ncbi:MAG TPA: glycoside hydrolase family 2 protein, partial [Candidatus Limnocylindria bacterium]|nr:glycoside hydrolase family 2 protein [Candidatus Limnocylindria bacterium]
MPSDAANPHVGIHGDAVTPLVSGWQVAAAAPGEPLVAATFDRLSWLPARVPGTVAGALRDAGREVDDLDAQEWWFRTTFRAEPPRAGEEVVLDLGGIATVAEVHLNGELIASSASMFARHRIDVGTRLREVNELVVRCLALRPLLSEPRRPRARWRTNLVADGNLRWFRTMLLGRAPGFAPRPAAVGPWRAVRLLRRSSVAVDALRLDPTIDGDDGRLSVKLQLRVLNALRLDRVEVELEGPSGRHHAGLMIESDGLEWHATGELRIPHVAAWWPHTHGAPVLHTARLLLRLDGRDGLVVDAGRVGFRALSAGASPHHDVERDGLDLHVNGERVFARGAVWTPLDTIGLAPSLEDVRSALLTVRAAGMNMVRIPGFGAYESNAFHDLCDELGILVWQDFMFANLDYPLGDAGFRATVEREVAEVLDDLAGRPSLAVLCGNSEVEQQAAMLGLDPALGRHPFFGEAIPAMARAAGADAVYVPSAPCGGDLPFRPGSGIANYYGVGAYLRPLTDARSTGVRFAAECLAFANVPDEAAFQDLPAGVPRVGDPRWKAGVPRDNGSTWDFDDVRDHYLRLLFDVDPRELCASDQDRYLALSRAVSGEVMAEVFGEWRRAGSPCGGGLVLWLRDLVAGAGWGLLDVRGKPKAAFHHLRRALAPVAVWTTDEGLGGMSAHAANDTPAPVSARLRVGLYRDFEV